MLVPTTAESVSIVVQLREIKWFGYPAFRHPCQRKIQTKKKEANRQSYYKMGQPHEYWRGRRRPHLDLMGICQVRGRSDFDRSLAPPT